MTKIQKNALIDRADVIINELIEKQFEQLFAKSKKIQEISARLKKRKI